MSWYREFWLEKCLKIAYRYALKNKSLNVFLHKNRLVVNGKNYTADNLLDIPKPCNPLYIFTPCYANKVAFYTSMSPLSNHFPSPLEVNGIGYNCMEQYFMHQKALFFNDKDAEKLILHTKDPLKQKLLGRKVKHFEKRKWMQHVPDILWKGLVAKFQQNTDCSFFLKNTGNCQLYEAVDPIYGVGINLFDSKIWDKRSHRGQNLMGIYLQKVRTYLFKNSPEKLCGSVEPSADTSKMDSVKTFQINQRKKATINEYKNVSYIHFYDNARGKSFSFSSLEFKELMSKKEEIEQCFIFLNRRREKRDEELQAHEGIKGRGEKRYAESDEECAAYGPPKQKERRPSYLPDYGEVPSSSQPGTSYTKVTDY